MSAWSLFGSVDDVKKELEDLNRLVSALKTQVSFLQLEVRNQRVLTDSRFSHAQTEKVQIQQELRRQWREDIYTLYLQHLHLKLRVGLNDDDAPGTPTLIDRVERLEQQLMGAVPPRHYDAVAD